MDINSKKNKVTMKKKLQNINLLLFFKGSIISISLMGLQGCLGLFSDDTRETVMLTTPQLSGHEQDTQNRVVSIQKPLMPDWLDSKRLYLKKGHSMQPLADIELIEPLADHFYYHLNNALSNSHYYVGIDEGKYEKFTITPYVHGLWIEQTPNNYTVTLSFSAHIKEDTTSLDNIYRYQCHSSFKKWNKHHILKGYDAVLKQCFDKLDIQLKRL